MKTPESQPNIRGEFDLDSITNREVDNNFEKGSVPKTETENGEIFIELEHKLLEMPEDLKVGHYESYAHSFSFVSGTFDGRKIALKKYDEKFGHNLGFKGEADGKDLSKEEAEGLWNNIYLVSKDVYERRLAER